MQRGYLYMGLSYRSQWPDRPVWSKAAVFTLSRPIVPNKYNLGEGDKGSSQRFHCNIRLVSSVFWKYLYPPGVNILKFQDTDILNEFVFCSPVVCWCASCYRDGPMHWLVERLGKKLFKTFVFQPILWEFNRLLSQNFHTSGTPITLLILVRQEVNC